MPVDCQPSAGPRYVAMSVSVLGVSTEDQRLLCVNSEDVVAPRGGPTAKAPPHKESSGSAGKLRLRDGLLER